MKLVSSSLLNEIKANVTTLATVVEIRRRDGKTYRLTNHDQSLTVEGNVYDHKIPFNLSAISSGSSLASDNTELTLFIDGETFTAQDLNSGVFTSAAITIMLVNFLDTTQGKVVYREGWFGPIDTNTYGVAKITIYGMLKVLDIEIGRVYQPACDADLGDKRCKIAIKQNQVYSDLEPYHVGEWVYHFDPAEATALTVVNPSFEIDAPIASNGIIPGWTKSEADSVRVTQGGGVDSVLPTAYDGTYFVDGGPTTAGRLTERFISQDIDLVAGGINAADIDAGKISVAYFANLIQMTYEFDPPRLVMEVLDADLNVIDSHDDGYEILDPFDVWRERAHIGPLIGGARYLRLFIYFNIKDGVVFNAGADNVRLYWWDHTAGSPYLDLIHKVARISAFDTTQQKYAINGSFEDANMANSNTIAILGWTRGSSADWWRVDSSVYLGIAPPDASRALIGGDDSSGVQKTYQLSQTRDLVTDYGLVAEDIDLGIIIAKLRFATAYYDTVSAARVVIDYYEQDGTTLVGSVIGLDYTPAAAPGVVNYDVDTVVPSTARKVKITLFARSGVGVSNADVGFDNIRWYFVTVELPRKDDPVEAIGDGVNFATTAGAYTIDGSLIWKSHTAHMAYDEVATVVDKKSFSGTFIDGGASAFVTSIIRWISGANAGQRNLIRLWDPDTKAIKLYFPTTHPIQVGDRYQYVVPCHKRFLEDCAVRFDNVLNFRGFPHLPGKLT
jgi:hypothetical protein